MGASNFAIRFVPVSVVSRLELPQWLKTWLSYVPVSVMAVIVADEVLMPKGSLIAPTSNPYLLAAVPTGLVYHFTRNYVWATLTGIVAFLAFRTLVA